MRTISSNQPSTLNPSSDFNLDLSTFVPTDGQSLTVTAGGQSFVWNGSNSGLQTVQSGTYYVTLTSSNSFGQTTTMSKSVTVLTTGNTYTLDIFNSAGEVVDQISSASYGGAAPSQLSPDKTSIAAGSSGSGGVINFNLGNGTTLPWSGVNGQGQLVQSGSYVAQLVVTQPGGAKETYSSSITVLDSSQDLLGDALLGPNPLNMENGGSGLLVVKTSCPAGTQLIGHLYDLAGELVGVSANSVQSSSLVMDMGQRHTASGIYLLVVTAQAPWGSVQRRTFKVIIFR